jgi:hypothetical protein
MSLCPWCKANVASSQTVCPVCGKNPADHPSVAGAGFSTLDAFDEEAPDPGIALAAPDSVGRAPQPQVGYGDRFNDGFDDMDDEAAQDDVKLELDHGPQTGATPTPGPADAQPGKPAHSPSLDPIEIAVLADFGAPPSVLWMCPPYAVRVLLRKRALNQALRTAQKGAAEAEAVRDEKLAAIAEKLRASLDGDRELEGFLAPLAKAEQSAKDRELAMSDRSAEYASLVASIDQKIASEETLAAAVEQRLNAAADDEDGKAQLLTRAQAALKRAEIELRNAENVARAAAGPEAREAPAEHAQTILQARTTVELRRQELAAPKADSEASQRMLRGVQAEADEIDRRIRALRSERARAESTFSREIGVRSEGVEQARSERRSALIAIGARLIDSNAALIPKPDYDAFHRLRIDVSTRHIDVERIMRALASADAAAVKRGWIVIGAAAGLVLALLVFIVSRFGG